MIWFAILFGLFLIADMVSYVMYGRELIHPGGTSA